ncbi:hypothetical protein C1Y63_10940 [Corynebacterium sp. 13CS0277]|uniref:hypothetical protein n=1 Tax=Corynebacterium sp. 13CS0277 TaxID=2071994 RepID=UPI000D02B32F|nr:hypothetical protein [Corynebacterium sp. 13CS0277]PRQ10556.1 hypothetical protein C1Y63_10940 [Corynebacterium sp. 13CS0277]
MTVPENRSTLLWILLSAAAVAFLAAELLRPLALPAFVVIVCGTAWLIARQRRTPAEGAAAGSLQLAALELGDVVAQYESFCDDMDADAVANRTLHRPSLMDGAVDNEDLQDFFFQYRTARRFLNRLPARMAACTDAQQIDKLLTITTQRTMALDEAWRRAYRTAAHLGVDYPALGAPRPLREDHPDGGADDGTDES